jgi:CDP-diacylglycerol pyrophosphatase
MIGAAGAFYIARILWPMFQPDIASDNERMRDPSICVAKASEHSFKELSTKKNSMKAGSFIQSHLINESSI